MIHELRFVGGREETSSMRCTSRRASTLSTMTDTATPAMSEEHSSTAHHVTDGSEESGVMNGTHSTSSPTEIVETPTNPEESAVRHGAVEEIVDINIEEIVTVNVDDSFPEMRRTGWAHHCARFIRKRLRRNAKSLAEGASLMKMKTTASQKAEDAIKPVPESPRTVQNVPESTTKSPLCATIGGRGKFTVSRLTAFGRKRQVEKKMPLSLRVNDKDQPTVHCAPPHENGVSPIGVEMTDTENRTQGARLIAVSSVLHCESCGSSLAQ